MVAHRLLDVTYRYLTVGLHVKRHRLLALSLDVRQVSFTGGFAEHVIETPHTGFTRTQATEIQRTIGISKAEILVHSIEISFLAGKGNHIGRIQAIILVVQVELVDAALVGMRRDAIIGNAHRYPYGTLHARTFAYHLHNPRLVRVGDRE